MNLIVAVDKNWAIGKGNKLLVSIPQDMKFFRETTMGHVVVMGGNTLRSFPNQKPLKNRVNIVVSRGQVRDDCIIVPNFEALKQEMKARQNEDIFVIGGGVVYKALLPYCHGAYVTKVQDVGGAEVFFPNLDEDKNFVCVDEGEPLEDNGRIIRFTKYENKAVQPL